MRFLLIVAAVCAALSVPMTADAQCSTGKCPAKTTVEASDIPMPTVDGRRWHLSFFYHAEPTQLDMRVATWLFGNKTLREGVLRKAAFHAVSDADPAFAVKDEKGRSWSKFCDGRLPAIVIQDGMNNRVYSALAFRGNPIMVSGCPIHPLPASDEMLVDQIRKAAVSWQGFLRYAGRIAVAPNKPELEFPPERIMKAAMKEGDERLPELGLLRRLYQRRQHWQQYRQDQGDNQDQDADTDEGDDVDVAVDIQDIANQWGIENVTPPDYVDDEPQGGVAFAASMGVIGGLFGLVLIAAVVLTAVSQVWQGATAALRDDD
jgi:hypothetical protein